MPRFDGTGPEGKGPRTGRGLGTCKPNADVKVASGRKMDGTGPNGAGPRTGRGLGNCKPNTTNNA